MNAKSILWLILIGALSLVLVLTINWFLDGLLAFLVPGATMTPELGNETLDLGLWAFFLIVDILTIVAVFKWLRR